MLATYSAVVGHQHNPTAIPGDTSGKVWQRQMAAMRAMSVEDRLASWAELNRRGVAMHEAAVRRRHPEYSNDEVFLAMVKGRYGSTLAAEVWPASAAVTP